MDYTNQVTLYCSIAIDCNYFYAIQYILVLATCLGAIKTVFHRASPDKLTMCWYLSEYLSYLYQF